MQGCSRPSTSLRLVASAVVVCLLAGVHGQPVPAPDVVPSVTPSADTPSPAASTPSPAAVTPSPAANAPRPSASTPTPTPATAPTPGPAVTPIVSVTPAPAPGPADPCLTTTIVGPGAYKVYNGSDALLQTARTTYLCSRALYNLATAHVAVPSIYFPGQAKSQNAEWNAAVLSIYCIVAPPSGYNPNFGGAYPSGERNPQQTDQLPLTADFTPQAYLDWDVWYDDTSLGYPDTPATYYNVSDKSSYWLHNIVGSESSYSDSTFYEPDAKSTKVSCPSGQKFIGVRVAQTYGGIDYLDFVCAPTCYTAPVGAHVTVGSVSVTVGSASEEPAPAAAAVAPTPSQTNTCTPSHIGPGATLQAYNPALVSPTIVKASCPGNAYITQWDIRPQPWKASPCGERVAFIAAKCSDGTFLDAIPAGALNTTNSYGKLGNDVYFTAGGSSGVNDANGWNAFPAALDRPGNPFGLAYFLGVLGNSPGNGDSLDQYDASTFCPTGQRATGYVSSGFRGGGVAVLDLICAPYCGPQAPSPAGSGLMAPDQNTPYDQYFTGCGSTVQAHIGPGSYGLLRSGAPKQGPYYTSVCPAGSYIREFHIGVSSFDADQENSEYETVITHIKGYCARTPAGAPGGPELQLVKAGVDGNETEYRISAQSGFTTFDISPPSEPQLAQFLKEVAENPAANFTLKCPGNWKAIGYVVSPFNYGIDFFDIICGPPLPDSCPQTIGGKGSGGQCPAGDYTTSSGPSGSAGTAPPFTYTTSPTGPSWNGPAATGRSPPPPPAKKTAGNNIDRASLKSTDVYLNAVISASGPASELDPFPQKLQDAFNASISNITGIPRPDCRFVGASRTNPSASAGRRLLEEEVIEHEGRHLLQTTVTEYTRWSLYARTPDAVANSAEALAVSMQSGSFIQNLKNQGIDTSKLTVKLESTSASDTQSSTQASTTCTRKFGSICVHNSKLSTGDIVGIIIGGVVFIILVAALAAWLVIRRRRAAAL